MSFVKVNMRTKKIALFDVPEKYAQYGGRALTSIMIDSEVPPTCDPLGAENKLIFAPGFLSGTPLVNTSRLSVGAKSPLTGGIKESNVGGTVAADLAYLGISAVIIEEKAKPSDFYILKIDSNNDFTLIDATQYQGMRNYALVSLLKSKFGQSNSITCIGPAGEKQLPIASIQTTDMDGRPSRAAGRGGLGAVMGSKGLKAIIVARDIQKVQLIKDLKTFKTAAKQFAKAVREDETSGQVLPELGTNSLLGPINALGAFPCYNATKGTLEDWEKISGEALADLLQTRGGKKRHRACAGCIIHCSNEFVDKDKRYVTSGLEYETIWALGGMPGIINLDTIAKLDFMCDDIGIDTMSAGVAISVAMDAGLRNFGDDDAALELVEEIAKESELGKLIGSGPSAVGKHFNHQRVPVVKGQSIAGYDPRAINGMAVTYATSPMGADHTAGFVVEENIADFGGTLDRFSSDGQVEASRNAQIHEAVVDSLGICDFAQSGLRAPSGLIGVCKMITAKSGKSFNHQDWVEYGLNVLEAERAFNRRAGFTKKDDRLPRMFYNEPLPPHNKVVVVTDEQMDTVFDLLRKANK